MDLASSDTTVPPNIAISQNRGAGGIHRARNADVYAWCGSTVGGVGTVFQVTFKQLLPAHAGIPQGPFLQPSNPGILKVAPASQHMGPRRGRLEDFFPLHSRIMDTGTPGNSNLDLRIFQTWEARRGLADHSRTSIRVIPSITRREMSERCWLLLLIDDIAFSMPGIPDLRFGWLWIYADHHVSQVDHARFDDDDSVAGAVPSTGWRRL